MNGTNNDSRSCLGANREGESKWSYYASRSWEQLKNDSTKFLVIVGLSGAAGGTAGGIGGAAAGYFLGIPGSAVGAVVGGGIGATGGAAGGAVLATSIISACKLYSHHKWFPPYLEEDVQEYFKRELEENPSLDRMRCGINLDLPSDPVVTSNGKQVYDRSKIEDWVKHGGLTDPVTGQVVNLDDLRSGVPLMNKNLISLSRKQAQKLRDKGNISKAKAFEKYELFLSKKLKAECKKKSAELLADFQKDKISSEEYFEKLQEITETFSLKDIDNDDIVPAADI